MEHSTLASNSLAHAKLKTYDEAVQRGDYELYTGNLHGKYDNVRAYWEDQLTRLVLRPFIVALMERKQRALESVRIVDLGCGTGQGYELLTKIDQRDLDLGLYQQRVLSKQDVACYLGLDISEGMVARGNAIYADDPKATFVYGDLSQGLGETAKEAPFDIYYSAYGSLSHLDAPVLQALLVEIVQHGQPGSLVVLDLLGRYSLEWPCYWDAQSNDEKYRDYSMSYLYSGMDRPADIEHFPIRFWTGSEVDELGHSVAAESGVPVTISRKYDRSMLMGRHVDTGEYNPTLKPIRQYVNSLHEDYMRTDIRELLFNPLLVPTHPDPAVAAFFEELVASWNKLVTFFEQRIQRKISLMEIDGWEQFPAPLQFALMTVDRVINSTEWMWYGDPRANVIEPQLGYALRSLEHQLQRGLGCGHGLLVVLEIGEA
ncbi:MAG: class I SAM-dependent methyltransferase [Caldilineaceae bacterium]